MRRFLTIVIFVACAWADSGAAGAAGATGATEAAGTSGAAGTAGTAAAGPRKFSAGVARSILFIGNSFTFAHGSPVLYYRTGTVTDLNGEGLGGVPALFKSFSVEAELNFDVFLETHPGVDLDWHLAHRSAVLSRRPWDAVVLQSYSTLDEKKPGDAESLVSGVRRFTAMLRAKNPAVELRLTATWPRADLTYQPGGAWYGKPIEAMARDVRMGYELAATGTPGITAVVGVGDAWVRAMQEGIADANPYDGIDAGKMDLWTFDNYHASTYGYYLEALMLFGSVTGRDPRSLGETECSGYELGLSPAQVAALEKVAGEQLAADGAALVNPPAAASVPASAARRRGGSDGPRCAPVR